MVHDQFSTTLGRDMDAVNSVLRGAGAVNMDKHTTKNANRNAVSSWEDEGGAGKSEADSNALAGRTRAAHRQPEEERRDKRTDDALPRRPNDEVPANRREDPRNEGRDQDLERKDRRSSS